MIFAYLLLLVRMIRYRKDLWAYHAHRVAAVIPG